MADHLEGSLMVGQMPMYQEQMSMEPNSFYQMQYSPNFGFGGYHNQDPQY